MLQAAVKSKTGSFLHNVRKNKFLCLLAVPGLLYFLIFKYVPMWGVIISFQDYSPYMGFAGSKWVGFEHFQRFFGNPDFWLLFRNTMAISVLNLLFFFPLPIVLSLLLNEVGKLAFKKTIQSVIYLPHFLSWVIIAGITFLMLSQSEGMFNKLLEALELDKVDFLTNPNYFWVMLTLQSIWKEAGWGTIIFLAAIAGVDPQLYEASRMDGASRLQQMLNITLPSIKNIIFILFILRLGNILDVGFEQVFLMMNGAVSKVGEVFDTYVYRVGIQQAQFSYSTAVGLFKSVIGFLLVVSANKVAKKFGEEGVY
jgi:putative aldouronate transport system permease protein